MMQTNLTLKIEQDATPEDPRDMCDHLGTMVCTHGRYNLGDEHFDSTQYRSWEEAESGEMKGDYIYLPLYLMDHSGLSMRTTSFGCPWDSGQVGFIYVTKEDVYKEYEYKKLSVQRRARLEEYLRAEVAEYSAYLEGDVWGYRIIDEKGDDVESCWGYYGHEYAKSAGESVLESLCTV